ncbi:MAG TPA: hypothetical protein ACFYEK_15240 [Candidatus Wunengus sp. YC60]|uniref:hypothetical protein n=1 Tax=Candidatus Wunengus sp. YC60 TaxID=3367697 RepID=UPI004025BECE
MEWEYKALQEVIYYVKDMWGKHIKGVVIFNKQNEQINNLFKVNSIKLVDLPFEFKDEDHKVLFKRIIKELVYLDPFLTRILFSIRIPSHNIVLRELLKDCYLPEKILSPCYFFFQYLDVLENSELAKSIPYKDKHVKSIPLCHFITGKIIEFLFSTHDHYHMIDRVKQSGAKESIEELRKNRIYESDGGTVYDYTPIWKKTLLKDGISYIWEVFSQAEYDYLTEGASQQFDEILCGFIKKPQPDPRPNVFFGNDPDISDSYVIIRYGTKEMKMPFRLLPKYKNLIKKIVEPYEYTNLKTDDEERYKEEERQEAIIGLFNAATTWCKDKGAVPYWLEQKTIWHLGDAFDKVSDVDPETKERKLMKRIESKGGSLDEPESAEDDTPKRNNIDKDKKNDTLTAIEQVDGKDELNWLNNLLGKYPKMKVVMEKESKNASLTDAERQYKKWFIDKHKKQ